MIDLAILAKNIEDGLNNNALGFTFSIAYDENNYQQALNTRTEKIRYTNGLLTVVSSAVVPIKNMIVATQSARLDWAVQLPHQKSDAQTIKDFRSVLDSYFSQATLQSIADKTGKIFTVSGTYTLTDTGTVAITSPLGTHCTFSVAIQYAFVQNGLNSYNCSIALDGIDLDYTDANITRVPTAIGDLYSNGNGVAKNFMQMTQLSVDLEMPAITPTDELSRVLFDFLLTGNLNEVHDLSVRIDSLKKNYRVILGQTGLSIQGIQNGGFRLSFIEASPIMEDAA